MVRNRTAPATRVGARRVMRVRSPTFPFRLSPQHHAEPSVATPQLFSPAAAMDWKRSPARTATGTGTYRACRVPSPSMPKSFAPQQYAPPSVVRPQV